MEVTKQLMEMKRNCDKGKCFFILFPGLIVPRYCISVIGDWEFVRSITQGNNSERLTAENQRAYDGSGLVSLRWPA